MHYCGPDANREVFAYIKNSVSDFGLAEMLQKFQTMYPYLKQIALSNKIKDPFDDKAVEAYWIGNELLESVEKSSFYRHMVDDHHLKKRIDLKSFSRLKEKISQGALPHHSFHVMNVWKRTGHVVKAHTIESIDACRVSWGKIKSVHGPKIKLKTQPVISSDNKLVLGKPIEKTIIRSLEADIDIDQLQPGDVISIHWNVPCEILSQKQVKNLKKYTLLSINFANQGV
jgi:hypothetical protein